MSSTYVRSEIINFLGANSAETFLDLSGEFDVIDDFLDANAVGPDDNWIGVEFIGSEEIPVTVGANNITGRYRESGGVSISIVAPAALGASSGILTRAEVLRNLLRGQRIGDIVIDNVTPANFDSGALRFEGGWMSAGFFMGYEYEYNI
jgi:hypothetical protein